MRDIYIKRGYKMCSKCNEIKPEKNFYFNDKAKTVIDRYCKICRSKMNLERYYERKKV